MHQAHSLNRSTDGCDLYFWAGRNAGVNSAMQLERECVAPTALAISHLRQLGTTPPPVGTSSLPHSERHAADGISKGAFPQAIKRPRFQCGTWDYAGFLPPGYTKVYVSEERRFVAPNLDFYCGNQKYELDNPSRPAQTPPLIERSSAAPPSFPFHVEWKARSQSLLFGCFAGHTVVSVPQTHDFMNVFV